MKNIVLVLLFTLSLCHFSTALEVVEDSLEFMDQKRFSIGGYLDTYYIYEFNEPESGDRPYFVSMARHNEVNVNLAFIDLKYETSIVRARFIPGFGTYMNNNYADEEGSLRNIVEANAGLKLFSKKNIWIDFGIFGSPFTNESAVSRDHLAYTRSFAPEYVPYYLVGIKLSLPLTEKINLYLYGLNGWQQIKDQNSGKSIATQLEFQINKDFLINWSSYIGNESSASEPNFVGLRKFTDLFFILKANSWKFTGSAYVGQQEISTGDVQWYSINFITQYSLNDNFGLVYRIEHFDDDESVQIIPITDTNGFSTSGTSLGINYKVTDNFLIRTEGRLLFSKDEVYLRGGEAVSNSAMIATNVTVWF